MDELPFLASGPAVAVAPAVASTDETTRLILENMRLQATFSGFQLENDELQAEVEECHSKLKELQARPVVRAEVEVESPAVQAVQALEPEPQMEDPKTEGWVIIKAADSFPGLNSVVVDSVKSGRSQVKQTDGGFCWTSGGDAFLRADKTPTEMVNAVQPGHGDDGRWDEVHIKPGATISSIRQKMLNYVILFENPTDKENMQSSQAGGYMKSKRRKTKSKRRKKKTKRRKKKTKRRKK